MVRGSTSPKASKRYRTLHIRWHRSVAPVHGTRQRRLPQRGPRRPWAPRGAIDGHGRRTLVQVTAINAHAAVKFVQAELDTAAQPLGLTPSKSACG